MESMDPIDQYADTLAGFIEFQQAAHELTLEQRVLQTREWLALIYQNASALDPATPAAPLSIQPVSQWPSFGQFSEFWALTDPLGHEPPELRSLTEQLTAITDDLATGLSAYYEGHTAEAFAHLSIGFEERYGAQILCVLGALQRAAQNFRTAMPEKTAPSNQATIVMLDDTASAKPGVMGLRLHPLEEGGLVCRTSARARPRPTHGRRPRPVRRQSTPKR